MTKKNHSSERLGEVLDQSLKRLEMGARLRSYAVWPVWNDVVGKTIARNAQPEKIRNGVLFVKVSSPVWMQQLQFMKELLASQLNQRLQTEVVKNIFFFIGSVSATDAEEDSPAPRETPAGDASVDDGFLDSLKDPEIREAFQSLLRRYGRRAQKT